ncbi:hypothetical protein LOC68_08785 [Blastopirellula sp. JC732]|uniref:Uncharacterized protein n=1 Tax=Blastopirellula sediminis TaxID=2894196 RepID=A0A9X1MN17_9BACT|nr:hypothetical protein [Blastopirellula sediminis]MCC9608734.1 hypothetical protein [Blastopirellula sediminis]MCC9628489.1 hypothetical protein [Blastopirellula sediminis]
MNAATVFRPVALLAMLACFPTSVLWSAEPMRGPLPPEQQALIHYLADHHKELTREVKLRDDGYEATTTTKNKEVAAKLKQHLAYMQKRLGSGAMVRRWDPAFVELVKYHDQITTKVEQLDNGIKVVVTGKTPDAVKVAQNHAKVVSEFAALGYDAVREAHDPALQGK